MAAQRGKIAQTLNNNVSDRDETLVSCTKTEKPIICRICINIIDRFLTCEVDSYTSFIKNHQMTYYCILYMHQP